MSLAHLLLVISLFISIVYCVYCCFSPMTVKCYQCGRRVRVSEDGWFSWECEECGASGKARPF